MNKVKELFRDKFGKIIANYSLGISYFPFGDEPDPVSCTVIPSERITEWTPRTPVDPNVYAQTLLIRYQGGADVFVLVPGRAFDVAGTRHGRGTGWYDRFLAALPYTWLRIGMCDVSHISAHPLKRKPWDQPVDILCIQDHDVWRFVETHARG